MMSMLKAGSVRLPLDRVPALAAALEVNPVHLFPPRHQQLAGDTTAMAFQKIFGTVVTENELDWVRAVREALLRHLILHGINIEANWAPNPPFRSQRRKTQPYVHAVNIPVNIRQRGPLPGLGDKIVPSSEAALS